MKIIDLSKHSALMSYRIAKGKKTGLNAQNCCCNRQYHVDREKIFFFFVPKNIRVTILTRKTGYSNPRINVTVDDITNAKNVAKATMWVHYKTSVGRIHEGY